LKIKVPHGTCSYEAMAGGSVKVVFSRVKDWLVALNGMDMHEFKV